MTVTRLYGPVLAILFSLVGICLALFPKDMWGKLTDKEPVRVPNLRLLYKIGLEDVSFYARSGHYPDIFLAFSPDERLLGIGTFLGQIIVAKADSGQILWKRQISEAMIKRVAFSRDSTRLYLGAQGPEGLIQARDASTGRIIWSFPLAKDLLSGTPPEKGDIYGIYHQPGCYRLKVLSNGDLFVLGIHSWMDKEAGYWRRLSRLYRLTSDGKLLWKWPREAPMEATLIYADCDPDGRRIATVSTLPSDILPDDYPYPQGAFYVIDGTSGTQLGHFVIPPLRPFYDRVSVWESVAVDPTGTYGAVGTLDGRGLIFDLETVKLIKVLELGTPVVLGGIPVAATTTYVHINSNGTIFFQTDVSSIPFGLKVSSNQPAGPNPNAQTIWAIDRKGNILWRFSAGFRFQGFSSDSQGRLLAVAAGISPKSWRPIEQFGLFVFNTGQIEGLPTLKHLLAYYPTKAPLFFHLALSSSGKLIAVGETPFIDDKGMLKGCYQVHVLECMP